MIHRPYTEWEISPHSVWDDHLQDQNKSSIHCWHIWEVFEYCSSENIESYTERENSPGQNSEGANWVQKIFNILHKGLSWTTSNTDLDPLYKNLRRFCFETFPEILQLSFLPFIPFDRITLLADNWPRWRRGEKGTITQTRKREKSFPTIRRGRKIKLIFLFEQTPISKVYHEIKLIFLQENLNESGTYIWLVLMMILTLYI